MELDTKSIDVGGNGNSIARRQPPNKCNLPKSNSNSPPTWAPKLAGLLNLLANPLKIGSSYPPQNSSSCQWVSHFFIYFPFSFSLFHSFSLLSLSSFSTPFSLCTRPPRACAAARLLPGAPPPRP